VAPFEVEVVQLWRSSSNCARFDQGSGAVRGRLRQIEVETLKALKKAATFS
jgi:hypothetical protein